MAHRIRRVTCVVLVAAQLLTGCTSWHVVDVSPRALVDSAHVTTMQVWEKGGANFVLEAPKVSGDSLTGYSTKSVSTTRTISLTAVDRVAVRRPDGLRTVGAIGGGLLGLLALLYVMECAGGSSSGYFTIC